MNKLLTGFLVAGLLLVAGCGREDVLASDPATREKVWVAIQPHATA